MKIDILFIDGLLPRHENVSFLGYLLPLATILEENDFSFKILNLSLLENYSLQELYNVIITNNINVIGMTTNADNIKYVEQISIFIKKQNSNIKIILGGPEVTFNDIYIGEKTNCDFIVRGEGESAIIGILNALKGQILDYSKIWNITYKNSKNEFVKNKTNNIHEDIPKCNYDIFKSKNIGLSLIIYLMCNLNSFC